MMNSFNAIDFRNHLAKHIGEDSYEVLREVLVVLDAYIL
jgi:hypothetical protein